MGFAGMDCSRYPGDAVMEDLPKSTNLVWCGFYLGPAPSHPDPSWMDRRNFLSKQGWGLAPIYVGQQETGPGSHNVTAKQGELDAADACFLAKAAGFPTSSVIYLDIEAGGPISNACKAYLSAWADYVKALDFTPGVYCSYTSIESIEALNLDLKIWAFKVKNADVSVKKATPFKDDDPDTDADLESVVAWQWAQNCKIDTVSGQLQVDLDTASVRDLSQP